MLRTNESHLVHAADISPHCRKEKKKAALENGGRPDSCRSVFDGFEALLTFSAAELPDCYPTPDITSAWLHGQRGT